MTEHKTKENNINAALTYLIPLFTGIVFYLVEKEDKFIRFHAFQAILFGITLIGADIIISTFYIPFITGMVNLAFRLGVFALWITLMWKAYNNEKFELPYLGKIARETILK